MTQRLTIDEAAALVPITVTMREAKRISGLSHVTIYKLMKEGRVRSTTVGRKRLVSYASLMELLDPTHDRTHVSELNSGLLRRTTAKQKGDKVA